MLCAAEFALVVSLVLPFEGAFMGRLDAVFADSVAIGLQARANVFVILDEIDAVQVRRHFDRSEACFAIVEKLSAMSMSGG